MQTAMATSTSAYTLLSNDLWQYGHISSFFLKSLISTETLLATSAWWSSLLLGLRRDSAVSAEMKREVVMLAWHSEDSLVMRSATMCGDQSGVALCYE